MDGIKGVLLDVDGTLLDGEHGIPGASHAIERLRHKGLPFRLCTNTTRRPRRAIAATLEGAGIEVGTEEIVVPASLARRRILESGRRRAALLVSPESGEDFLGVTHEEAAPDWVVLGDLGRGFTFDVLNRAFHWLRGGATLLALHKNRFWHAGDEGMLLDAGPFVAALEYAAGVTAEVVGKPSAAFFHLAIADLDVSAASVLVVGDSVENDFLGAARAGCKTALVQTGQYNEDELRRCGRSPDLVLASVADLEL